jgi:hypothetical protein
MINVATFIHRLGKFLKLDKPSNTNNNINDVEAYYHNILQETVTFIPDATTLLKQEQEQFFFHNLWYKILTNTQKQKTFIIPFFLPYQIIHFPFVYDDYSKIEHDILNRLHNKLQVTEKIMMLEYIYMLNQKFV